MEVDETGGAPPSSSPPRGGRKRRLSMGGGGNAAGGGGGAAAGVCPLARPYPGVFDRVASRRLRPQGPEWVLEADGVRAYLPSLLRLLRDADESKVCVL
jgi:hypothetical protein